MYFNEEEINFYPIMERREQIATGCECFGDELTYGECDLPSPVLRFRGETEKIAGVLCQEKVENYT